MIKAIGYIRAIMFAVFAAAAVPASAQSLHEIDIGPQPEAIAPPEPLVKLGVRLAYNTELGPVIGASVGTDQLFGRNQSLDFAIEASEETLRYNLKYAAPDLFGGQPAFGMRVFAARTERGDVFDFDSEVIGFEPRLAWQIDEATQIGTYANFSWGDIYNLRPDTSDLVRRDVGTRARQAVGVDFKRRYRGTGDALQGLSYGMSLEGGHSDMGHDFLRVSGHFGAGWTPGAEKNVLLKMRINGSALNTVSGSSNIGDRTFLGQSSLRGFAFGGIGPRDLAVATQPALGGNFSTTAQFDAQFRNLFDSGIGKRLTPGVFVDMGSVWGLDDTNGGVLGASRVDDSFRLRASGGVSLQLATGAGPVLLSIAGPILRESYDDVQEFSVWYQRSF